MDAGAEIIGELIGGAVEVAAGNGSDKKGCGCLIAFVVALLVVAAVWYYYGPGSESQKPKTESQKPKTTYIQGKIIYKLDEDGVLLETKNGKHVYHIGHELYINKNEGDSLCITITK